MWDDVTCLGPTAAENSVDTAKITMGQRIPGARRSMEAAVLLKSWCILNAPIGLFGMTLHGLYLLPLEVQNRIVV